MRDGVSVQVLRRHEMYRGDKNMLFVVVGTDVSCRRKSEAENGSFTPMTAAGLELLVPRLCGVKFE